MSATGPAGWDEFSDLICRLHSLPGPIHSIDLVLVARELASNAEWERIELYFGELDRARRLDYLDGLSQDAVPWRSLQLTPDANAAITKMTELSARYGLEHMGPALLAFAALLGPTASGAARLMASSGEHPDRMRSLAAEAILGTQLEGLTSPAAVDPADRFSPQESANDLLDTALDELLLVVLATAPIDTDANMATTADLARAAIRLDPDLWWCAADEAGIDLHGYSSALEWASTHRPGFDERDATTQSRDSASSPMTAACALAVNRVRRWSMANSKPVRTSQQVRLVLAAALLVDGDAATSGGISDHDRAELRVALIRAVALEAADAKDVESTLRQPLTPTTRQQPTPLASKKAETKSKQTTQSKRAQTIGLFVGGYGGAVLISAISGLPLGEAIGLATIAIGGITATRRRRVRTVRKPIAAVCVLTVLLGAGLAVAGSAPVKDDLHAASLLAKVRTDVGRGKIDATVPLLGEAELLSKQSVALLVTSACVDWRLHFYDYALLETSGALLNGWNPSESSHFDNNDCFLDVPAEYRLEYTYLPYLSLRIVYPQANDPTTQALEQIAITQAKKRPEFSLIAAACILDHYDLRATASYYLTVGLNSANELNDGKLPFAPLLTCIRQPSLNVDYGYVTSPTDPNYDLYEARDFLARVPSPQHPNPPANTCWAELPLDVPCAQK